MPKSQTPSTGFGSNWIFALFVVVIVAGPTVAMTTTQGTARTVAFAVVVLAAIVTGVGAARLNRKRNAE